MNIYIDESGPFGGFKKDSQPNIQPRSHLNTLVAAVVPERNEPLLTSLMAYIKNKFGQGEETKLIHFDDNEEHLFYFLLNLQKVEAIAFYCATDLAIIPPQTVANLHSDTVKSCDDQILITKDFREKAELQKLKGIIKSLKEPLYFQLFLQIVLSFQVLSKGINVYAFNDPKSLSSFNWLIDTKQNKQFLKLYKRFSVFLLEYMSQEIPVSKIKGGNYDYIDNSYACDCKVNPELDGVDHRRAWDLKKILTEKISFVNSKEYPGVQAADIIASSYRRCLMGGFKNNDKIAEALGELTIKDPRGSSGTLGLHAFGDGLEADDMVSHCAEIIHAFAR